MLQVVADFSHTRLAWLLLALAGITLELAGLYLQYGMQLDPCVLCIYERVAVLGLVAAGLIGLSAPRRAAVRWIGLSIWGISAAWGIQLAFRHVGIQFGNPTLTCSFFAEFPEWAKLDEWLPAVFAPTGYCDEIAWTMLGMSLPQWLLVVFGLFLAILALVVISQFGNGVRKGA